jgi:hypothetical protein
MSTSLALALAALIQSPSTPPAAAPPAPAAQAKEAAPRRDAQQQTPPKGLWKRLKATLTAVDTDAMTIAFRDETGRANTWPVDKRLAAAAPRRAAQAFKDLNPGDSVWIFYSEDDGPATIMNIRRARSKAEKHDQP